MSFRDVVAPRNSRRRIILSILRDVVRRPTSLLGRLAPINFHNSTVRSRLKMHCPVCGQNAGMTYDFPDVRLRKAHGIGLLRETLGCKNCGASMRDRQMAVGLLSIISRRIGQTELDLRSYRERPNGSLRILDTDSFSAINRVLRGLQGYIHSQLQPDLPGGQTLPDGSVNVDLLNIPYDAGSFDVIMTSDVMEHVAQDERAHAQIFRCLAPQGTYVFTVPFDPCLQATRRLTQRVEGSEPMFFLEKHVHGDPHAGSGILAHRIYGQQLIDDLRTIGYEVRFENIDNPAQGIFGGDLFLATKRA